MMIQFYVDKIIKTKTKPDTFGNNTLNIVNPQAKNLPPASDNSLSPSVLANAPPAPVVRGWEKKPSPPAPVLRVEHVANSTFELVDASKIERRPIFHKAFDNKKGDTTMKRFFALAILTLSAFLFVQPVTTAAQRHQVRHGNACKRSCREERRRCTLGRKACKRQFRQCVHGCPR